MTRITKKNQGRDVVDGNNGADTFAAQREERLQQKLNIYTRAAWLAFTSNTTSQLSANTEVIIATGLTNSDCDR